jgi:hypothetical protein
MPGTELPVDPPIGNSRPEVGQPHRYANGPDTEEP